MSLLLKKIIIIKKKLPPGTDGSINSWLDRKGFDFNGWEASQPRICLISSINIISTLWSILLLYCGLFCELEGAGKALMVACNVNLQNKIQTSYDVQKIIHWVIQNQYLVFNLFGDGCNVSLGGTGAACNKVMGDDDCTTGLDVTSWGSLLLC